MGITVSQQHPAPTGAVTGPELGRLVGSADVEDFWEARPHLATGLGDFDDVFDLEQVDRLVTTGGLRLPAFRLVQDGRALVTERYCRAREESGVEGLMDPAAVVRLVAQGATLSLMGLRAHLGPVDAFSAGLAHTLGHRIHANAYLTPPGASGAGAHWDLHSVFIRQVAGAKRWTVREPLETWPRRRPRRGDDLDTPLVAEVVLEPGDCLYLPRGYVHDGWAVADSPSVHITFGLRDPVTWIHLLTDVVAGLDDDARLREILPLRFADDPRAVEQGLAAGRDLLLQRLQALDVAAAAAEVVRAQRHEEPTAVVDQLRTLMSGTRRP